MKTGDRFIEELAREEADARIRAELTKNLREKWGFCPDCGFNIKHPLYVRGDCCR